MKYLILPVCLLFIIIFPVASLSADDGIFTVAGIQFEISPEIYESDDVFFSVVEGYVQFALDTEYKPDLIVFPEYIGVFYQLMDFNDEIAGLNSFGDALIAVLAGNPGFGNMADVFIKTEAWKPYHAGFSRLAEKYSVFIVAGSCFISDGDGRLFNRTFVFDPQGRLEYRQNKVFLTDFERDIVGLTPGRLEDAHFFKVDGRDIALTICRDAYSPEWEQKHSGAYLWIDIKANGEVYNEEQRSSFMRALPARVMRSDVFFGMTVCAVGNYLDLFWEGASSAFYKNGSALVPVDISESYNSGDVIYIRISEER